MKGRCVGRSVVLLTTFWTTTVFGEQPLVTRFVERGRVIDVPSVADGTARTGHPTALSPTPLPQGERSGVRVVPGGARPEDKRSSHPAHFALGHSPGAKSGLGIRAWRWHHLPDGLLYASYLAGPKESRIGTAWLNESDRDWVWDSTLGGRAGIVRFGTDDPLWPEGWQLDIEGAGFARLDLEEESDLDSSDFRFGVPLTWRRGPFQTKFAYYHLSSHAGDEFLERNPGFQRINFSRNAVVLGLGYFPVPDLRLYAEADYGFDVDVAEEWWFQFGFDYAPAFPTGLRGAPFLAMNGLLREEVDFGGSFNLMAGWAWRGDEHGHLCRVGLQYFNGKTTQFELFQESEQLVGLGFWYDY